MPGHGRSPETASLNRCMASWRGRWQVLLGMILLGTAMLYTCSRFPNPPILLKAADGERKRQTADLGSFFVDGGLNEPVMVRMMAPMIITKVCRVSV